MTDPASAATLPQVRRGRSVDLAERSTRAAATAGVLWLTVGVLAVSQVVTAARVRPVDRFADLHVYWGAVHSLAAGQGLYAYRAANGDPFTYPPVAALLLGPLGVVSEGVAQGAWTVSLLVVLLLVTRLVAEHLPQSFRTSSVAVTWPAIALVFVLSAPFARDVDLGQVSLVVFAAAAWGVLSRRPGAPVALGLACAVKLTPLVLVPFLWLTGRRRAAALSGGMFAVLTGLGWVLLPEESRAFWLELVRGTDRYGDILTAGNQSLLAMLRRTGLEAGHAELLWVVVAVPVSYAAYRRAIAAWRSDDRLVALAVIGCLAVVLSPVSWSHHQLWTLLAAVLLHRRTSWVRYGWAAMVIVVMTYPVSTIHGPALVELLTDDARGLLAIAVAALVPIGPQARLTRAPSPARRVSA